MNTERQGALFDLGHPDMPPAQQHSATSRDAAEKICGEAANLRAKVLAYIQGCGIDGATDEEGIDATGLPASTYRPRRVELVQAGLVMDSGRERPTRSGRKATVWVV